MVVVVVVVHDAIVGQDLDAEITVFSPTRPEVD